MAIEVTSQFETKPIFKIVFYGLDLSFTNASAMMLFCSVLLSVVMAVGVRSSSRFAFFIQVLYDTILSFISGITAKRDNVAFFLASLCLYIGTLNIFGMFLFAPTSDISITASMAISIFLICILTSINQHGWKFFKIFIPHGVPILIVPIIAGIEFVSYLMRPISLGMRLAANIIAGHIMLGVLGHFVLMLGYGLGWLPFIVISILAVAECAVGLLQAYIFTILSSTYIGEANNH